MLSDLDFKQFARQIAFSEIGEVGQKQLLSLKVLIVGVGGLGCSVAQILVRAGVRHLVIIDPDTVARSNLPRQILYHDDDIGSPKVVAAKKKLMELSPLLQCRTVHRLACEGVLHGEVALADIVVDCTDNREARLLINRTCLQANVPLISGACIGWEGVQMQFAFHEKNVGCYECLFPTPTLEPNRNCQSDAIASPVVTVVAARQALMVLRFGWGVSLPWQTLFSWRANTDYHCSVEWSADPQCSICGQ